MLLEKLLESYTAERPDLSPRSVAELLCTVRRFAAYLSRPAKLTDLQKPIIIQFAASFASAFTANKHRVNLLSLWNHAEEKGLIHSPPKIPRRKEPLREPVVWTLGEVQRLWAATDLLEGNYGAVPIRVSWKVALAVLWDSAARIGTLYLAELSELNLSTGIWHAPAEHIKGKRADKIYRLHPDTLTIILDSIAEPRKKLWPFPYSQRQAIRQFGILAELAGLQSDRWHKFHCIRRTAESYAAANMGIEAAAAAVGHSESVAQKHYINPAFLPESPCLFEALPRLDAR